MMIDGLPSSDTFKAYTPPQCAFCTAEPEPINLPAAELVAWQGGALIQSVFPLVPIEQREFLISGTHPACWDAIFGDEEDA